MIILYGILPLHIPIWWKRLTEGLGTAGAVSLIAAGREGLSVLGVEQLGEMGGIGTSGGICYYYFGAEGGLYTEIDCKAGDLRQSFFHEKNMHDTKSLALEREAEACGAKVKYNCIVTGVYMEENKLRGLRLFQNGRVIAVLAGKIIDAERRWCVTLQEEKAVLAESSTIRHSLQLLSVSWQIKGAEYLLPIKMQAL